MGDAEEPPPTPLSKLLGKLGQYSQVLKTLGYDDVDEFFGIDDEELSSLKARLLEHDVPAGSRAICVNV